MLFVVSFCGCILAFATMATPPTDNDDYDGLLARLTALKGSKSPPTFLSKEETFHKSHKNEVDIESRFRRLASGQKVGPLPRSSSPPELVDLPGETVHNEEDDRTLEELLAELNAGKELPEPEEDQDISALLKEARSALPKDEPDTVKPGSNEAQDTAQEQEKPREGDHLSTWEPGDEEAADEYISQVLAELELEVKHSPFEERDEDTQNTTKPSEDQDEAKASHAEEDSGGIETQPAPDEPALDLPSAPSSQLPSAPSSQPQSNPSDEKSLAERLAKLSLPSIPRRTSQSKGPPKFTNEEIDSWCVICNDDATVRCLGCDGDLYCQRCWDEGHRGKDAGYEEKMHRAVVYNRGVKGKKVAA